MILERLRGEPGEHRLDNDAKFLSMANGDDVEDDDDWFESLLGDENPVETGLPGVRSLMVIVRN